MDELSEDYETVKIIQAVTNEVLFEKDLQVLEDDRKSGFIDPANPAHKN